MFIGARLKYSDQDLINEVTTVTREGYENHKTRNRGLLSISTKNPRANRKSQEPGAQEDPNDENRCASLQRPMEETTQHIRQAGRAAGLLACHFLGRGSSGKVGNRFMINRAPSRAGPCGARTTKPPSRNAQIGPSSASLQRGTELVRSSDHPSTRARRPSDQMLESARKTLQEKVSRTRRSSLVDERGVFGNGQPSRWYEL